MCFMQPLRIKRSTFFFVLPDLTDLKIMYLCKYVPTLILTFESNSHLSLSINCTFFQIFMQQSICSICSTSTLSGIRLSLMPWTLFWRSAPALIFASMRFYLLRCLLRLEVCVSPILKTRLKPLGGLQGMLLPKVAVWPSPGIDSSSASSQANIEVNKSA